MLAALMAVSAALVIYSAIQLLFIDSAKERMRKRIDSLADKSEIDRVHSAVLKEKREKRKAEKQSRFISRQFRESLESSGLQMRAREYMSLWVGLTLVPGLLGLLFGLETLAIVGLCVVGFAIPPFLLNQAKSKRQLLFNKQLGESLTIMSNCLRSGYSFQQAMNSIAKEMQPPISTEFARVVREINYGSTMEDALHNMVGRVDNKDLELLVSAVITSTQVGANLSDILDIIAETVGDRIRIREEVRIASAQGRSSGFIIGGLPVVVVVLLMIINPEYFGSFVENQIGKLLIAVSVVLEISGFLVINKIVDIKY